MKPGTLRIVMLTIDAVVDLALGFFLVLFPVKVLGFLGLPVEAPPFYAVILGGVLIGIGIALLSGLSTKRRGQDGLGLGGALFINLFGALALASLLIGGRIYISLVGYLILLGLLIFLLLLCSVELLVHHLDRSRSSRRADE
jgi:hypothetical protein